MYHPSNGSPRTANTWGLVQHGFKAKASSLTRTTDGEDGIFKLVIGGDAFVESDGLELGTAEPSGYFWTDSAENEIFATEM
ncbi:hypothetical protein AVEN_32989-1 [Araneus ventricosus]|uniref:Uncharacterized protein n=1 Tax=Araneus ventricosus TaxID=182803 RepID=A0A4Y2IR75_ARAVE|nr:hypothetical protein AVEN_32989-1 [Araneus ventricosus]